MAIFETYNMPFAAALILMAMLALLQVIGLSDVFGDADFDFDTDVDGDAAIAPGLLDGLASVIGLGRIPLMAWLTIFLGLFAAIGVGVQELAITFTGGPFDRWLAALIAAGASLPLTGAIVRPLGRILPHDETSAVSTDTLLGRRGVITDGTARAGSAARARVADAYGHPHHVMVEPHEAATELCAGDEILLVRRENELFFATALAPRALSPN